VPDKYDTMRIAPIPPAAGVGADELDCCGNILESVSVGECSTATPSPTVAEEKDVHARPAESLGKIEVPLVAR